MPSNGFLFSGWASDCPLLLDDFADNTGADGPATFTDGEAQLLVHGDRGDQADAHGDVVAGHDHLRPLGQFHDPGHVGRAEVELRAVPLEDRITSYNVCYTKLLRSSRKY